MPTIVNVSLDSAANKRRIMRGLGFVCMAALLALPACSSVTANPTVFGQYIPAPGTASADLSALSVENPLD